MTANPPGPDAADAAGTGRDTAAVVLDGRVDPDLLGGKGAALDRLVGWGFPVPTTGAVTIATYRRFVAHTALAALMDSLRAGADVSAEQIDSTFEAVPFDPRDAAAIVAMARRVGDGAPLAVRSSATVEDLERSSFAGQYHSVLDVEAGDADEVLDAVKAVFASLWHPAPRAYRRSFGIGDEAAAMAAVVMRMVPAVRAGVVFTVDPGDYPSKARVEAVQGLAESLVSGRRTPAAAVLPRSGPREGVAPEVEEALDLALAVEARAGCAQDVEWAWDGERVWLVQARPITVTGSADGDGFDDPPDLIERLDLTTAGIGEMLPGVLSPLLWTVDSHLVEESLRRLLDDLGLLPPDLADGGALLRRVRGRAAMDFARLQGMAGTLSGSVAGDLEAQYFGARASSVPVAAGPARPRRRLRSLLHDLRVLQARSRYAAEAVTIVEAIGAVLAGRPDLGDFDGRGLLAYHLRLLDLAGRGMTAELGVATDATATHRRLETMLGRYFDGSEAQRATDRMVAWGGVGAPVDDEASAAVFAGPTWAELGRRPPGPRASGPPGAQELPLTDVRAVVEGSERWNDGAALSRFRLRAMRRLAADAADRLARREQAKAALLALGGEVRRVHLEIGRRLVGSGALDDPGEVDLLTVPELRRALLAGTAVPPDVVRRRSRWRTRYEQEGPLPARFTGRPTREADVAPVGRQVEGWAASAGRFRGRVQVVTSPDEELAPDAVLVAEATDPSWSPLFVRAGALVLDRGGPLSHAAILARELGLPAVLNVPGATSLLAGHEVTVDGDLGIVVVHDVEATS